MGGCKSGLVANALEGKVSRYGGVGMTGSAWYVRMAGW